MARTSLTPEAAEAAVKDATRSFTEAADSYDRAFNRWFAKFRALRSKSGGMMFVIGIGQADGTVISDPDAIQQYRQNRLAELEVEREEASAAMDAALEDLRVACEARNALKRAKRITRARPQRRKSSTSHQRYRPRQAVYP